MTSNLHPVIEDVFKAFGFTKNDITWADERLEAAYLIIQGVSDEQHPEGGPGEALRRALDDIETADCELEELTRSYVRPAARRTVVKL